MMVYRCLRGGPLDVSKAATPLRAVSKSRGYTLPASSSA